MKKLVIILALLIAAGVQNAAIAADYIDLLLQGVQLAHSPVKKERTVYFNTNSYKYHAMSCTWATRCTRNCIEIPLSEAITRGGVPCKVCGGGH